MVTPEDTLRAVPDWQRITERDQRAFGDKGLPLSQPHSLSETLQIAATAVTLSELLLTAERTLIQAHELLSRLGTADNVGTLGKTVSPGGGAVATANRYIIGLNALVPRVLALADIVGQL